MSQDDAQVRNKQRRTVIFTKKMAIKMSLYVYHYWLASKHRLRYVVYW